MAQATVLMLRLSIALLIGTSLSEVYSAPLEEVQANEAIVDEEDAANGTREIELDIDLDDMPASITDAILRGDYSKIIEMETAIAAMNESGATDDTLDSLDYGRWDRSIIGIDSRYPVSSSQLSSYPYCAIGFLKTGCTAAFIGPRFALTAAHCVVGRSTSDLNMCRGRSCSNGGQLMHYANDDYMPRGYTRWRLISSLKRRYDYALLLYRETSPCYLRFGYRSPWRGYVFKLIGYPSDKGSHCTYRPMYYSSCSHSHAYGSYRFRYSCDSYDGNSGSPLLSRDPSNSNAQRIVYGVHTRGGILNNYGVRITRTRFCNFVEWMSRRGYTPRCGGRPCCS